MAKLSILVVEDDPLARRNMQSLLDGHSVAFAPDKAAALAALSRGGHDLCFIDLKLGKDDPCSGLDLIPVASAKGVYAVVMSGHDSEPYVDKAYALGCNDFYAKGNEERNIGDVLDRFLRKRARLETARIFSDQFVTQDPATQAAISEALKYAASELPLLILGPSGSGKTSLARIIHDHSGRRGPFVAINCAAYGEDLLEAELFGYRKGAFTGANENRKGRLLEADGGTLFLDEIGAMSLKMQTKLLKAIEEKTFYPIGADKPETSDFRVLSATLEDMQALIKAGKMRFDFFQRIHGFSIRLKPLAERKGDLLPLISFFVRGGKRLSFAPEAKAEIANHDWPGNIRELRKFVELLAAADEGRVSSATVLRLLRSMRVEQGEESFVTNDQYHFALDQGLYEAMDRFVDTIIHRNLAENGGKKTKTLAGLKIAPRLLYSSLKRFGGGRKEEAGS